MPILLIKKVCADFLHVTILGTPYHGSPKMDRKAALEFFISMSPPRSLSRMAVQFQVRSIPKEWYSWSEQDDWKGVAEAADSGALSDRIRSNWNDAISTQEQALQVSDRLLMELQVADLGDKDAMTAIASASRAASETIKLRMMVLENLQRPVSVEQENSAVVEYGQFSGRPARVAPTTGPWSETVALAASKSQACTIKSIPLGQKLGEVDQDGRPVRRGRGRPRIHPLPDPDEVKRGRGRPEGSKTKHAVPDGQMGLFG